MRESIILVISVLCYIVIDIHHIDIDSQIRVITSYKKIRQFMKMAKMV